MMKGKQKLYFLLNKIDDARVITPTGQLTALHPADNLKNKYSKVDLLQLLTKLEKDEKVINILKVPNTGVYNYFDPYAGYTDKEDGCFYIDIFPAFDEYFAKIQSEPEYQEFSNRKPSVQQVQFKTVLKPHRKALEKIWNVLQEIEEKKQLGTDGNPVRLAYYPTSQGRDIEGLFETRKTVLEKLQSEDAVTGLHKTVAGKFYYWSFKLGINYLKVFSKYEKLYSEMAKQFEDNKKPPSEKTTYYFDKESGILTVKGNEISFRDEGRRIPYLDLLTNNNDYIYHSEVAEILEGATQIKEPKNTYYEVCRGIKTRLLEFGITNFLESDFNKARINPLYKKEPKQTT